MKNEEVRMGAGENEEVRGKSDLISRQDVEKALQGLHVGDVRFFEKLRKNLAAIPSTEPERKWIPVTEALPKDTEFVLLTIRRLDKSYSQIPFISVGYISWNQSAWWCAHDGDCNSHNVEVLAWMPLPEPWKETR